MEKVCCNCRWFDSSEKECGFLKISIPVPSYLSCMSFIEKRDIKSYTIECKLKFKYLTDCNKSDSEIKALVQSSGFAHLDKIEIKEKGMQNVLSINIPDGIEKVLVDCDIGFDDIKYEKEN